MLFFVGLNLDDEKRNQVKELKEKISALAIEFSKNCTEESTKLNFTAEQLSKLDYFLFTSILVFIFWIIKEGVNEKMLNSLPKVRV